MAFFDVIAIGASAGGVTYLQRVVERLPADFPVPIFIALHLPDGVRSMLPRILERAGSLPVTAAEHGTRIRRGHVYVAPPGFHLTIDRERMHLSRGAREHGHRPAIDPLFRSAALAFGPRVIGVVLSGLLDDGTVGLIEIKRAGGMAVVQDPEETAFPSMPRSAIEHADVDHVLPAGQIGDLLRRMAATGEAANVVPNGDTPHDETVAKELEELTTRGDERDHTGAPSPYACPECGGVLFELEDETILRFRCRVGHAYTAATLTQKEALAVESSLWAAVRALEEQAAIKRRIGERAKRNRQLSLAASLERRVKELDKHADDLRALLLGGIAEPEVETEA